MSAQENYVPLPLRSHTILGVCEAIGEDFHFNPTFLRVILAAMVLYSPMIAFGSYFALGAVVLVSRLVFPNPLLKTGDPPFAALNLKFIRLQLALQLKHWPSLTLT